MMAGLAIVSVSLHGCGGGAGKTVVPVLKFGDKASMEAYVAHITSKLPDDDSKTVKTDLHVYHRVVEKTSESDDSAKIVKMFSETIKVKKSLASLVTKLEKGIAERELQLNKLDSKECQAFSEGLFFTASGFAKTDLFATDKNGKLKGTGKPAEYDATKKTHRNYISMNFIENFADLSADDEKRQLPTIVVMTLDPVTVKSAVANVKTYKDMKLSCFTLLFPESDDE